ncbi:MAG: hypothetical protein VX737_03865 [Pseudomonadota bacterium]|nr:hypothetical protein [Pseudomonadota bacterium]
MAQKITIDTFSDTFFQCLDESLEYISPNADIVHSEQFIHIIYNTIYVTNIG